MRVITDIKNYRAMSEPFPSSDAANKAVELFFEMVQEARKTCKIQDVHIIVKFHVMEDEAEKIAMTSGHLGNVSEGIGMCAWGLKSEMVDQNTSIKELLGE